MLRVGRACLLVALLLGCLPAETREEPGSLALSVRTTPGFIEPSGWTSDDGWTLHVDRYLVGLGSAELDGDDCEAYSEGGYGRILDMTRSEPQPLSLTFGLGRCELALQLSGPRWDSVLGAGVPAEVATLLAVPGTDTVRDDVPASVYVEGRAERGAVLKRFAWAFRAEVSYETCRTTDPDGAPQLVSLRARQRLDLELVFQADALFVGDEQVLFDPIAMTDERGDDDGTITLTELASDTKLFEHIYFTRLPGLVAPPSGTCATTVNRKEADD
jgi:hypothetical protein